MKKAILLGAATALLLGLAACNKQAESADASAVSVGGSSIAEAAESEVATSSVASSSGSATIDASGEAERNPILDIPVIEGEFKLEDCVKLGDYRHISLERTEAEVTDEEVDEQIKMMLTPEEVADANATVQTGDTVDLAFAGEIDGEYFDGGTSDSFDLVIGSNSFIPGFEEGMVGMKKGEKKDLELSFPDDYWNEELAGKPVTFHVEVNAIKRAPEPTNDWVVDQTEGKYTTVEEYREVLRNTLLTAKQDEIDTELERNFWAEVTEGTEFLALPKSYIDAGIQDFEKLTEEQMALYGMGLDDYKEAMGYTDEQFDEQREIAGRQGAESSLMLEALAAAEDLTVESDEYRVQRELLEEAYQEDIDKLIEQYGERTIREYIMAKAVIERIKARL